MYLHILYNTIGIFYLESMEKHGASASEVSRPHAVRAFHERYLEHCRNRNVHPLTAVCKGRTQNALDFCADRVRLDEWRDLIRALSGDQCLGRVSIRLRKQATKGKHKVHDVRLLKTLRNFANLSIG